MRFKTIYYFNYINQQLEKKSSLSLAILVFISTFLVNDLLANREKPITSTNFNASINTENTGVTGGLCLLCAVTNANNVVNSVNDAATISMTLAITEAIGRIYVQTPFMFLANKPAGFVVQDPAILGLLDVNILNAISITTYDKDGIILETFTPANNSIELSLLQSGATRLEIAPTIDFANISIELNSSLLGIAVDLDVFNAFAEAADGDNDGILDAIEDTNGNCIFDTGETDPTLADTDNDGLNDGLEDANANGIVDAGETNPRLADTDNDGLNDGLEDANANGIVDAGETDPRLADSDNDALNDGIEDANANGIVDAGETDPRDADSDNDNLNDGTEDANGNGIVDTGESDPTNSDSDNDGVNDGDEINGGSSPTDPCSPDPNSVACLGTLPVTLVNFEAVAVQKNIVLTWTTAAEKDFEGFELQRAVENQPSLFETIAFVAAKGSSSQFKNYTYTDLALQTGLTYYYQLVEKDANGKSTFSEVVSVKLTADITEGIHIFPNPSTTGSITVESDILHKGTLNVSILSLSGQVIQETSYQNLETERLAVDISQLPTGMYLLQLTSNKQRLTHKFFVE